MSKRFLVAAFMLAFSAVVAFAAVNPADYPIKGPHQENEVACVDCHETEEPEKRANQRTCIDCHGDMSDDPVRVIKDVNGKEYETSIHASHAGQIRCTLCHASHKESVLYCNEGCHHQFDVKVP